MTNRKIAAEALSLLLRQSLAGRYSLSLFDVRKTVTGGRAIINSISEYEKTTGERLSSRPEGFTVKSGSLSLIFYDDRIQSRERINWTLAHELGHVCLRHTSDGKREESEANRFAAAFLMPEDVPFPSPPQKGADIPSRQTAPPRHRKASSLSEGCSAAATAPKPQFHIS